MRDHPVPEGGSPLLLADRRDDIVAVNAEKNTAQGSRRDRSTDRRDGCLSEKHLKVFCGQGYVREYLAKCSFGDVSSRVDGNGDVIPVRVGIAKAVMASFDPDQLEPGLL